LKEQAAFAAIDYRMSPPVLSLGRLHHGLSLQLLATLLVLQAHGETIAKKELVPAAAFYVRLLRKLELVEHPAEGDDPDDPMFALRGKNLRGVFDADHFRNLDRMTQGGMSPVVYATVNKDGSLGRKDSTDFVEPHELEALLDYARRKLAALADELLEGRIEISPWRIGTESPCPSCTYRGVCRFDVSLNGYRFLSVPKKEEVIQLAVKGVGK
jgi:ATP-dependent helicase/nuclease subunit B